MSRQLPAASLSFVLGLLLLVAPAHAAEPIPEKPTDFLINYCLDCHDEATSKGEMNLDFLEIDWTQEKARHHWERVIKALEAGQMPPEDKDQPTAKELKAMIAWLDKSLTENSEPGGTVARRLNRDEYQRSVNVLFGKNFQLPPGFPEDTEGHGFDNVGETLVLSPPLMSAYAETAAMIADEVYPPDRPPVKSATYEVNPDDMVISYSSSSVRDGAMRLVSKSIPMSRSCTWPTKVEIPASGIYRVQLKLSTFKPKSEEPLILEVRAREVSSDDGVAVTSQRLLKTFEVPHGQTITPEFEAELYVGETLIFYYANAPLDSDRDDKEEFADYLRDKFAAQPRHLAAWQAIEHGQGIRGGVGWERIKALLADKELDMSQATLDSERTEKLIKTMTGNPVLYVETLSYDHFENGPGLDVHQAVIEGPLRIVDGPLDKQRMRMQQRHGGTQGKRSDEDYTRAFLKSFLTKAYRRPIDESTLTAYEQLVAEHCAEGHSLEQGFHLAIRTALISPRFLYRSLTPGKLDDYDLASRLSYFLTSAPPDANLTKAAEKGNLTKNALLFHAERMLPKNENGAFIKNFTGQWLDTRSLPDIMPDPRLKFNDEDQRMAREEVEAFFSEMLVKNRPMTDFIDPDFTYTSARIAKNIYGVNKSGYDSKNRNLQRISLERGGRYGGVLGQAAVLMATANGVDTQPVIRGVWVLENILGSPPPPPPKAVPAITPDTTGAKTPRDLLAAHASEVSCAGCHKKIDPIGFALENYDPVGRWREHYPIYTQDKKGQPVTEEGALIDASGQLPDGTPIKDAIDLKLWIVENIDQFSECLAEKLMTYATGRHPNYAERKEIAAIVEANHAKGNGFRDLLLALIDSETFRTK